MKKFLLLIIFNAPFIIFNCFSQSPGWQWAKAIGGTGAADGAFGYSIGVDLVGNGAVYTTGRFLNTVDFDPGVGVFNLTGGGGFISKLDSSGNFIWAKAIGGIGFSIAIDSAGSGDVYTTGYFTGTADFDPGAGVFNLSSAGPGFPDIFISKLDSSGNFVWAKAMGGTGQDVAYSIVIDPAGSGDVYTIGQFRFTADFDPGAGVFNLTSAGQDDIFISKLDSSGNFVWAKAMGGTDYDDGYSIAIDPEGSGDVYTTGLFYDMVDFDPGAGVFNLTSAGGDIFISKLDGSGNFVWAKAMGGTGPDQGISIAIDPAGSGGVYTSGGFNGTADFDPDSSGSFNLTSNGWYDIFISKLDSSGNFVWAKAMGGTTDDQGYSIAIDPAGNGAVYTTGYFKNTVDFDPGAGVFPLTSAGLQDIFISKLDGSGNFVWAKAMGGISNEPSVSISLGASGNVYLTGTFESPSITFGSTTLTNAGGNDIFIARLDTAIITGNNEIENLNNSILLFPNPANNHLTIVLGSSNKKVELTITDITGKIIYKTIARETLKIDLSIKDFAEGIYLVQIKSADFLATEKLIVSRE